MTETDKTPSHSPSFREHPLYQAALEHLAAGEEKDAIENLAQLGEIYPEEQELDDLRARVELRAALESAEYTTVGHRQPRPFLRQILMILLTVTLALCGIASVFALYERYAVPLLEAETQEEEAQRLLGQAQRSLDAGNAVEARKSIEAFLAAKPGHPEGLQVLARIETLEVLNRDYVRAVESMRQEEWQAALDTLNAIQARSPGFKDIEALIERARDMQALQGQWEQVPAIRQAEDWPRLAQVLEPIRQNYPEFHTGEVTGLLFEAYVAMARGILTQANADLNQLNEAIRWYDKALALRPADQNLADERKTAVRFVRGSNDYAQGNAIGAVDQWAWIWQRQPNFQGGVLRDRLSQAYPQAARDKVARANGQVSELTAALTLLDEALIWHPGDGQLVELRQAVVDYLAGAEAAAQGEWNVSISYWGPLFAVQPEFQNGVLRTNLYEACANSTNPDPTYCSP